MIAAVYGIGYVGAVAAGCIAAAGHHVVAVDINPAKVDTLNAGRSPLAEPGLAPLIEHAVRTGQLRATTDSADAFAAADIIFICVGTPGGRGDRPDLSALVTVAEDIGRRLGAADDDRFRVIAVRSTVLPGTMDGVVKPALERQSGLRAGHGFGLAVMPEFLREGQGVDDFRHPDVTVIGVEDDRTAAALRALTPGCPRVFECGFRTAEAIKFTNNAFHALKIAFANEIGAVCKSAGVDGRVVMDILCADQRLNISRAYLRPGFAFGGSCLPKDVKALCSHAGSLDVRTDLLRALIPSNDAHIARAVSVVAGFGCRRVSLLGLTFKPGTDDLRDSPLVELAERLIGKGFSLRIYDPNFDYADIMGRNRQSLLAALPHVGSLLADTLDDALAHAETVVIGHAGTQAALSIRPDQRVLDMASGAPELAGLPHYQGLCW